MTLHHILVVHDSPAVRETVGILLAGEYEVQGMEVGQYLAGSRIEPRPRLVIADPALAGRALPDGAAVLWLDDGRRQLPAGPTLARQFTPRELRRTVDAALAADAPAAAAAAPPSRLEPPFVPVAVAALLAEAVRSPLPLHLAGEPGVGKRAIARAVHAAAGRGQMLAVEAGDVAPLLPVPPAGTGTLYVAGADRLSPAAQQHLLAALGPAGALLAADGGAVRLITATTGDLGEALDGGRFSPELYYRLTLLRAALPPLRERAGDIPILAQRLVGDLAAALGRPPVELNARALQRLSRYLWFGNVSELEAVLARSLALGPRGVLDADDLAFDGGRLPVPRASPAPAAGDGHAPLAARQLDLIINELAHEFKNPLVTLKTFAHHLRRTLPNGDDAERAAALTGEAVEQIDQTLENLLEFTRLADPVPQVQPLARILDPVLEECRYALAPRGVHVEHDAVPPVAVHGDPQQLAYALGNLFRALARDLPHGAVLRLGFTPPATLSIRLPAGADPLGNHLATLLDRRADPTATPPLGVAIATAVLDRNGAALSVAADAPATVVVRLPAHGTEATSTSVTSNGSTASTDR